MTREQLEELEEDLDTATHEPMNRYPVIRMRHY